MTFQNPKGTHEMIDTWGDMAQEVRAVVWQSEVCWFDPTLGVSQCPRNNP